MSRNVEGVAGQDSMYGSLTNSLICPNAVQFPPTPVQGWQGPMGWQQNNGTIENRYTNYYPGHMIGATPDYMYSEPELVTYDEGNEDFYENQQRWVHHEGPEAQVNEHKKVEIPFHWHSATRRTLIHAGGTRNPVRSDHSKFGRNSYNATT